MFILLDRYVRDVEGLAIVQTEDLVDRCQQQLDSEARLVRKLGRTATKSLWLPSHLTNPYDSEAE